MKAVQPIGVFGKAASTTISALNAVERTAVAVSITADSAVTMASWANEEIENLRLNRAIKREVESEIYRTKYVMEAAAEVASAHAEATAKMANANPETKAIFDALVAKHLK